MPDDWRDKLAALDLSNIERDDNVKPGILYDIPDRGLVAHPSTDVKRLQTLTALDRDELNAAHAAALDKVLTETGRTIREPHLTHQERQDRLRGIPAIGSVGGAIKGTRPDHA